MHSVLKMMDSVLKSGAKGAIEGAPKAGEGGLKPLGITGNNDLMQ